jgi:hypothetical protein
VDTVESRHSHGRSEEILAKFAGLEKTGKVRDFWFVLKSSENIVDVSQLTCIPLLAKGFVQGFALKTQPQSTN